MLVQALKKQAVASKRQKETLEEVEEMLQQMAKEFGFAVAKRESDSSPS